MVTNVVFALLFVFCLIGMLTYKIRADVAESKARNTRKLYDDCMGAIAEWSDYAASLEAQLSERDSQAMMLQKIYHATYGTMKDSYGKLLSTVKVPANNGNGKDSKQQSAATTQPDTSKSTLADLGTITAREQSMIDKWHKANNTPDAECVKRINNIRASESKREKQAA
jgi:hypothetical protein